MDWYFTDALAMKGVAAESDVTVKALKAGNDMVLVQQNVEKAQESVVQSHKKTDASRWKK